MKKSSSCLFHTTAIQVLHTLAVKSEGFCSSETSDMYIMSGVLPLISQLLLICDCAYVCVGACACVCEMNVLVLLSASTEMCN